MSKNEQSNLVFQALRREAEQLVAGRQIDPPGSDQPDLMKLVYETEIQHVELELQNQELQQALGDLEESRNSFYDLYQTAPVPLVTVNAKGLIEQINEAAARLLFDSMNFVIGRSFAALILPEDQPIYFTFLEKYATRNPAAGCELRLAGKNKPIVHIKLEAQAIYEQGKHCQWRFGMLDITALKQTEAKLEKAHDSLEATVKRRTAKLRQINLELSREVASRKQAQIDLQRQSEELEQRTIDLQEANIALKVLLKERDAERHLLEEKLVSNIEQTVRPQLNLLADAQLHPRQSELVNALQRGLDDILSPLSRRFIIDISRLTPMETTVANLIRQGRSTKQISALLGVATSTIDFHRRNIRRKLHLTNKKDNLQTHLQSLR